MNYHKSYYERNKIHLRAYQRAYYHRKKKEKGDEIPKPKKEKIKKMEKKKIKIILHFD
tara:strand:- start:745 stop:918 length:174 start_codon:yes stop_codon:yes gene_type:complete